MYADLAWLFPIITPVEHYVDEAAEFVQAIQRHAQRPVRTLLNLGTGGGHNDHFQVTGLDLSEPMLALAQQLNPDVDYLVGDMRSADLQRRFDAVILADAASYLLSEADLRATFLNAFRHLEPGGVFCTYAEETLERFVQNDIYTSTHRAGEVEVALVENYYDPDPQDSVFEMTFLFLIRQQGQLRSEVDQHEVGLFPVETWRRLLAEVGFQVHEHIFADGDCPFFTCIKPLR
jgi:SAM-dependent methyltransferase